MISLNRKKYKKYIFELSEKKFQRTCIWYVHIVAGVVVEIILGIKSYMHFLDVILKVSHAMQVPLNLAAAELNISTCVLSTGFDMIYGVCTIYCCFLLSMLMMLLVNIFIWNQDISGNINSCTTPPPKHHLFIEWALA